MRKFQVLFDDAEASSLRDPAYQPYGELGFPALHPTRPWTYANFVQSIDGIASFKGKHASGGDISESAEDRWLMDLLRAHADAILMGLNTLIEETRMFPQLNAGRGPVYRVEDPALRALRGKLGRKREKVIFVTASAQFDPAAYRVLDRNLMDGDLLDGDQIDAHILTTSAGAAKLAGKNLNVIVAGESGGVDLPLAMRLLRDSLGIQNLLCEGGPTLYGNMSHAGLIDEKFVTVSPVEIGLLVPPEQEPSAAEKLHPPLYRPTTFTAPGFLKENAPHWRWMSCRRIGDHQFNRYRRR